MLVTIENEVEADFGFDIEEVAQQVIAGVLEHEKCPYEDVEVNVLITDDEGIREYNNEYRGIDRETDVLSFPNLDFEAPAVFDIPKEHEADYFDPDTGCLYLGDVILNENRIRSQADEYGHSLKREYAFLIAHSLLHLCGYDHMEPEEAADMEARQEEVLCKLHITRAD